MIVVVPIQAERKSRFPSVLPTPPPVGNCVIPTSCKNPRSVTSTIPNESPRKKSLMLDSLNWDPRIASAVRASSDAKPAYLPVSPIALAIKLSLFNSEIVVLSNSKTSDTATNNGNSILLRKPRIKQATAPTTKSTIN